ncbi:MAG: hypothetical protein EOO38_06245 [Cytophagaceae bacterium]|nr:MAG: hypothetical protein EOO38_06245 [Cytophagaceae bacterium]
MLRLGRMFAPGAGLPRAGDHSSKSVRVARAEPQRRVDKLQRLLNAGAAQSIVPDILAHIASFVPTCVIPMPIFLLATNGATGGKHPILTLERQDCDERVDMFILSRAFVQDKVRSVMGSSLRQGAEMKAHMPSSATVVRRPFRVACKVVDQAA